VAATLKEQDALTTLEVDTATLAPGRQLLHVEELRVDADVT
jgi:hypothetical protein